MGATPERIGPYPVQRVLGEGAMGKVFQASHPRLGREVAIKLLHERDPEVVERFRREAELMARIRDPRVVKIYEAGLHEGEPFVVLEFCPGRDLAEILRAEGALAPERAARLVAEVARGVAAAHAAGAIHRDLKPANILVGPGDRPKVTDFGIAAARTGDRQSLTQSGVILGTPAYMAPEQALDPRAADARSDVYALGAVLYECLSGRRLFTGATHLAVLSAVMEGRWEPLSDELPEALRRVVACALAQDPGDRFASATLLAESLEDALADERGGGAPAGRRVWPALAVVAGLLVAAGAYLVGAGPDPGPGPSLGVGVRPSGSPAQSPSGALATPTAASGSPAPGPSPTLAPSPSPSAPAELPPCRRPKFFAAKRRFRLASVEELLASADAHPAAMTQLAQRYADGFGTPRDFAEAARWLERAAAAGDPQAMSSLARCYERGQGVPRDLARARALRQEAVDLGYYAEVLKRAQRLGEGSAGQAMREEALSLARQDAEAGDPTAITALLEDSFRIGRLAEVERWLREGLECDLSQAHLIRGYLLLWDPAEPRASAAEAFRRAHEFGSAEGSSAWAGCLLRGLGVQRDEARGLEILEQNEERDRFGVELERLRLRWARGEREAWWAGAQALAAAPQSRALAHRWGELAMDVFDAVPALAGARWQGAVDLSGRLLQRASPLRSLNPRIPYNVGVFAGQRHGPERARPYYERAAHLGHKEGAYFFGTYFLKDPATLQEGIRWLRFAGEAGHAHAWWHLAVLHQFGVVPEDELEVLSLLARASELEDPQATLGLSTRFLVQRRFRDAVPSADRARRLGLLEGEADLAMIRAVGSPFPEDAADGLATLESLSFDLARACKELERMYEEGLGVEPDLARAKAYARRGAELMRQGRSERGKGR